MTLKIAIYGKGGIGKSTICSNLSVALARRGYSVLQVGCDPKHDSTYTLCGRFIPTVIDTLNEKDFEYGAVDVSEVVVQGKDGVAAVETGGPTPGSGCGGFAIAQGIKLLKDLSCFETHDIVIFDVLGDIVCGGFTVPMKEAATVYIVTSDDLDSLFAANRINSAVHNMHSRTGVDLGGIIANRYDDLEAIQAFVSRINARIIGAVPRNDVVRSSKFQAQTLFELDCLTDIFDGMVASIVAQEGTGDTTTISDSEFFERSVR
ncbi:MAG: AAA family ATPase [Nanobdellota archaeon]